MPTPATDECYIIALISACAGLLAAFSPIVATASPSGSPTWGGLPECGPGVANHPVRVVPSEAISVPGGWPLNGRGEITCLTCHTEVPSGGGSRPMLRDTETTASQHTAFCAKCHRKHVGRSTRSIHWLAVGMAHVPADRAESHADGGLLGSETRQCLSCHDGAMASESNNITPWSHSIGFTGDRPRNHPVDVRYDNISRAKNLSPLRPSKQLPPEVALPNGKVSCVSCHNLYSGKRMLLTVPIQGSKLCFTCHEMN